MGHFNPRGITGATAYNGPSVLEKAGEKRQGKKEIVKTEGRGAGA